MSENNDSMVMLLKEKVRKQKEELRNMPQAFRSRTSCIYIRENGEKKNLRVMNVAELNDLRIHLHMYEMAAEDLGLSVVDYPVSGFTIPEWMADIESRLDEINRREKENELIETEKLLDSLLSDDKKTELTLQEIAKKLGV